jgi:hypothetical protein
MTQHETTTLRMTRPLALVVVAAVMGSGTAGIASVAKGATAAPMRSRSPTAAVTRPPVPASLTSVESAAEDIVEFALQRKRADVVARAGQLKAGAAGPAAKALAAAGAPAANITALKERAARVAAFAPKAPYVRIAIAANSVSALMPSFYARFADPVPPSVLTLDYLDREAQLRSLVGEQSRVTSAVDLLARTWAALRPKVIAVGGVGVARQYDRHVASMRRLAATSERAALQKEAVNGLELVDSLESAFPR